MLPNKCQEIDIERLIKYTFHRFVACVLQTNTFLIGIIINVAIKYFDIKVNLDFIFKAKSRQMPHGSKPALNKV